MKRIIAAVIAVCMLALAPVNACAQEIEMTSFEAIDCYEDGTFSIMIHADIKNLAGVHLRFIYDRTKLRYKSQKTLMGHGDAIDDGKTLEWSTMLDPSGQKVTYMDTIATLEFDVIGNLKESDRYISVGVVEAYDGNMNDVDYLGKASFTAGSSGYAGNVGDVDHDGNYTANDALAVLRASLSTEPYETAFEACADVNHDQTIDASDALIILRHSVGMTSSEANIGFPIMMGNSKTIYMDSI